MGGYIAHHQVYTIFQGLPRQVPPDHMCHSWPISRVGSRAQNFALKSQISLPHKSLRTLWTFFPLRPIMGHERAWDLLKKKSAENWDPVPPNRLHFFLRTLFFLFFGGTPLHKLCTWLLLITFSAELSIQTYGSAELNITKCVLLLIQWLSLGFLLNFFRRNSTSQNVRLSSADLGFFSAENHKSGDAWLPMIPYCCMFISQC